MGKAKYADVWLVRAGCTQWDQEGRIVGAADLPTCQAGLEAARSAARTLSEEALSAVLCADTEAAQTTGRLIAEACETRLRALNDLGEMGLGLWEGTLACDIEGRCPTIYRQWKNDPSSVIPPEGEAFEDALNRVRDSLGSAIAKYAKAGQGVAIVVGPTVFGIINCWLRKQPPSDLWKIVDQTQSLQRLAVDLGTMTAVQAAGSREDIAAVHGSAGSWQGRENTIPVRHWRR